MAGLCDNSRVELTNPHGGLAIPKNQWILDWLKGFLDSECMPEVHGKFKNDRDFSLEDTAIIGGEV